MSRLADYIAKGNLNEDNKDYISNTLKQKKYIIDRKDMDYVSVFPELLLVSLENDFYKTCDILSLNYRFYDLFSDKFVNLLSDQQIIRLNKSMLDKDDNYTEHVDYYVKDRMNNYLINKIGGTDEEFIKACSDCNYSLSSLPEGIVCEKGFLSKVFYDDKEVNFVLSEIHSNKPYTRENELKLLEYLNSDFKTLEEHLVSIGDKKRNAMSILEVMALEYYGKKVLKENLVDDNYSINAFIYSEDSRGAHSDSTRHIYISDYNCSVKSLLHTLHHECSHAIMHRIVYDGDVTMDEDIEVYSKDLVLRDLLGEEYYKDNYNVISYEFDADFRAYSLDSKLFKNKKSFNYKVNDLYERMMEKDIEYAEKNIMYNKSLYREYNGKLYSLDELFLKVMNEQDNTTIMNIITGHPALIEYEPVEINDRLVLEEVEFDKLVETALKCESMMSKKIYFKIIEKKCRLDNKNAVKNFNFLIENYFENEEIKGLIFKIKETLKAEKLQKYRMEKGGNKNAKVSR